MLLSLGLFVSGCGGDDDDDGPAGGGGPGGSSNAGSGNVGGQGSGSGGGGTSGSGAAGLGNVGTGSVRCAGVAGSVCAAGSVCCERAPFGDNSCEPSLSDCADGLPVACDEPSDCPQQKCCAKRPGGVGTAAHNGTGCKAACSADLDRIVCGSNDDCQGTGACMQSGDATLKMCF